MHGPTANPAAILPALVDQVLNHDYSEEDIHKILGGNNMRVFEAVWDGTLEPDDVYVHKNWRLLPAFRELIVVAAAKSLM